MAPGKEFAMSKKQGSTTGLPFTQPVKGRRFSEEFKREAVRLVSEQRYTFKAAAAAVGVSEKSLRDWHAKCAPQPVPCGEHATLEQLREENQRLRRQLQRAELEREILKKATAYFAKESL
jgi:transposase